MHSRDWFCEKHFKKRLIFHYHNGQSSLRKGRERESQNSLSQNSLSLPFQTPATQATFHPQLA